MTERPPDDILDALRRMKFLGDRIPAGERLTGGVSSDIWRIELAPGPICVKRALAKLKVKADWQAPVERNIYEARWMRRANDAVDGAAPRLYGQDETSGVLAMAFLPPEDHPVWKAELHAGRADPGFAARVGAMLGKIHAVSAAHPAWAEEFPTDAIFYDIRLEPYLVATGKAHPDLATQFQRLVETTATTKLCLVHGDVSPKNILIGPRGPVFLDAECAWWGDPAFDLAFCLNHFLLKCLWTPEAREKFLACYTTCAMSYLAGVTWEPRAALEARAAALLPGLFLARVDGKSPVEYISDDAQKDQVRRVARALLTDPPNRLSAIRLAWMKELTA